MKEMERASLKTALRGRGHIEEDFFKKKNIFTSFTVNLTVFLHSEGSFSKGFLRLS